MIRLEPIRRRVSGRGADAWTGPQQVEALPLAMGVCGVLMPAVWSATVNAGEAGGPRRCKAARGRRVASRTGSQRVEAPRCLAGMEQWRLVGLISRKSLGSNPGPATNLESCWRVLAPAGRRRRVRAGGGEIFSLPAILRPVEVSTGPAWGSLEPRLGLGDPGLSQARAACLPQAGEVADSNSRRTCRDLSGFASPQVGSGPDRGEPFVEPSRAVVRARALPFPIFATCVRAASSLWARLSNASRRVRLARPLFHLLEDMGSC